MMLISWLAGLAHCEEPRTEELPLFLEKKGLDTRLQYLTGCWLLVREEPSLLASRTSTARAMRACYRAIDLKKALNVIVALVDHKHEGSLEDVLPQHRQLA
jgi:hypothetical protein